MNLKYRMLVIAGLSCLLISCDRQDTAVKPDPRPFAEVLAAEGLTAAEKNLRSQPGSPQTSFLLAGVQFLRAVEDIQRVRYANYAGELSWLPGMRTELPRNPQARFDPAFLEKAMTAALGHLHNAQDTIAGAVGRPFTAELQLYDVWLDINSDGERDDWEGVLHMMGQLRASPGEEFDGIIRFDTADADWLKAYIHFISGMAELTLAVDPTPAIRQVSEARDRMAGIGPLASLGYLDEAGTLPETIAATLLALRGRPGRSRTRAALTHFKGMMTHALAFWEKVEQETDNDHEWLPNPRQVSAFGVEVTDETAREWRGVLTELTAIFEGEALIPFWRFQYAEGADTGIGINVARLLQDPPDTDLILLIQGASFTPYFESGRLANMAAWNRFSRSVRGNAFLFAAWMN